MHATLRPVTRVCETLKKVKTKMKLKTLLISGFSPWDTYATNASWEILRTATFHVPPDWQVKRVLLPVSWRRAWEVMSDAWDDSVRAVLALGQAEDDAFRIERFAVNAASREARDVDGECFDGDWILPGEPAALHTSLPWHRLEQALSTAGLPVRASLHAGDFLCNYLGYRLLHHVRHARAGTPAGFVHVPALARTDAGQLDRARDLLVAEIIAHAEVREAALAAAAR